MSDPTSGMSSSGSELIVSIDQIASLLTGECSQLEQVQIIEAILKENDLIADFASIWKELRPGYSVQDPVQALQQLARLARAKASGPEALSQISSDPETINWARDEAIAFHKGFLSGDLLPPLGRGSWLRRAWQNAGLPKLELLQSWSEYVYEFPAMRSGGAILKPALLSALEQGLSSELRLFDDEVPLRSAPVPHRTAKNFSGRAQYYGVYFQIHSEGDVIELRIKCSDEAKFPLESYSEIVLMASLLGRGVRFPSRIGTCFTHSNGYWSCRLPAYLPNILKNGEVTDAALLCKWDHESGQRPEVQVMHGSYPKAEPRTSAKPTKAVKPKERMFRPRR